jgi:type 1 glutamine amidotransferase
MVSQTKPRLAFAAALTLCAVLVTHASRKETLEITLLQPMPRVLVFYKTAGFRHASIPDGLIAMQKLGQENNFLVDTTTDASWFRDDNLNSYAAVVFFSTTGDVLNDEQQAAFERYIQNGGGFVGVHAAADTEYDWPWYNTLLGAYFLSHPSQQTAVIEVIDKNHPSASTLPARWERYDEWYNFKNIIPGIRVIATLDETTYQGGVHGKNHPIVWYHEVGCGRAWYTALGHTKESYSEPLFLRHLLGGIQYAIGNGQACTTLPAILTGFRATPTAGGEVALTWQTATEQNTDYFLVERSQVQLSFNAIGRVNANGVASTYSFKDSTPSPSLRYYRLSQVDKDGSVHNSSIISVSVPLAFAVSVSPNPSSGIVQVSRGGSSDERVVVQVMDRAGNLVYNKQHQGTWFRLDFSGLPPGSYIIRVGEEAKQLLLVK